jgi:hypothetical protein
VIYWFSTTQTTQKEHRYMQRVVRVVARDGVTHDVPMRAEEAAFFMQMAELKAQTDPTITFHDVVAEWVEKHLRLAEERSNPGALAN